MNYAGNTEIIRKHFHDHQANLCIAVILIIPLAKQFVFKKGYLLFKGALKNIQGLCVENSRTFQGYPSIFQFSRTFRGHDCFFKDLSRPVRTMIAFEELYIVCFKKLKKCSCIRRQSVPSRDNDNFIRRKSICVSRPLSKFEISRKNHIFCTVKT